MSRRIDAYLSRRAQETFPDALVYCATENQHEVWTLEKEGGAIGLGRSFGEAKAGILAMEKAKKAKKT